MNPNAKDTDGYLKIIKPHECAQDWWDKLKDTDKKILYLNQDMCEFELYGTVDVFLCMLDSLNYVIYQPASDEQIEAIFQKKVRGEEQRGLGQQRPPAPLA